MIPKFDGPGNLIGCQYEYFLKDHLGNTRVVFHKGTNGKAEVLQEDHYDPFGYALEGMRSLKSGTYENKYLYNGKELQDDLGLGMYDYGARLYDPQIGRFHSLDPLAELNRKWSPYSYCKNNPLNFIDPDGMYSFPVYVNGVYSHTASGEEGDDDKKKDGESKKENQPKTYYDLNPLEQFAYLLYNAFNFYGGKINEMNGVDDSDPEQNILATISWTINTATLVQGHLEMVKSFSGPVTEANNNWAATIMEEANVNPTKGKYNCTMCAFSGDLFLRTGIKSSALNLETTYPKWISEGLSRSWNRNLSFFDVCSKMLRSGEGSTGIITGSRGLGRYAHTFNVTVKNNKIWFLDFQRNMYYLKSDLKNFKTFHLINTTGL